MTYSGPWRVVNSLTTLRTQLDAAFPERSHASDGTIADDAHETTSDHYPHRYAALGPVPVVTAFDGTQDPAHGCDNAVITEAIRVSRDARVKYVIWNHRMYSSYVSNGIPAWTWRSYTGSDPHTNHFHLSTVATAIADSTSPWQIGADMPLTPEEYAEIVQGSLTDDNVMHYDLRSILNGADPALQQYHAKGWTKHIGLKQVADALTKVGEQLTIISGKLDTIAAGGITHEALVAALTDPAVVEANRQAAFEGAQRAEDE
jgi:hypothetical protein